MTTPFPQGKNWGVEEDDDGNNGCTIEECRWILHNEDMGLYDKGKDAEEGFLSHLPDELKPDTPPLVRWVDGLQDGKAHQKRLFIGLHCIHLDKRIPSKEITDFIESMGYVSYVKHEHRTKSNIEGEPSTPTSWNTYYRLPPWNGGLIRDDMPGELPGRNPNGPTLEDIAQDAMDSKVREKQEKADEAIREEAREKRREARKAANGGVVDKFAEASFVGGRGKD